MWSAAVTEEHTPGANRAGNVPAKLHAEYDKQLRERLHLRVLSGDLEGKDAKLLKLKW